MASWGEMVPERFGAERLWTLVAHRSEAVLFESMLGRTLERVLEIRRGATPREEDREAFERALASFGRSIAGHLERIEPNCTGLVLLAEARLLGAIRWALPVELSSRVRISLIRPRAPIHNAEIEEFLFGHTRLGVELRSGGGRVVGRRTFERHPVVAVEAPTPPGALHQTAQIRSGCIGVPGAH